jgi:two-component system nitrate/nitrite sensor histidine kinase NarX
MGVRQQLRQGDPERPLFVPWDPTVRAGFTAVESGWLNFQSRWLSDRSPGIDADLQPDTLALASAVNTLVSGIEAHMARWTTLLHLMQLTMLAMAI